MEKGEEREWRVENSEWGEENRVSHLLPLR
jgi:hypothetical protein